MYGQLFEKMTLRWLLLNQTYHFCLETGCEILLYISQYFHWIEHTGNWTYSKRMPIFASIQFLIFCWILKLTLITSIVSNAQFTSILFHVVQPLCGPFPSITKKKTKRQAECNNYEMYTIKHVPIQPHAYTNTDSQHQRAHMVGTRNELKCLYQAHDGTANINHLEDHSQFCKVWGLPTPAHSKEYCLFSFIFTIRLCILPSHDNASQPTGTFGILFIIEGSLYENMGPCSNILPHFHAHFTSRIDGFHTIYTENERTELTSRWSCQQSNRHYHDISSLEQCLVEQVTTARLGWRMFYFYMCAPHFWVTEKYGDWQCSGAGNIA